MNNNNLIVAIVLSIAVLVGFQFLYVKPHQEQAHQLAALQHEAAQAKQIAAANAGSATTPALPDAATLRDRTAVLADSPRLPIETPEFVGSIDLKGARLDDLSLRNYRETVADKAPDVVLLAPAGSAAPHEATFAEFNWLASDKDTAVPDSQTLWQAKVKGAQLTQTTPVTLTWSNGHGLDFERVISVDDHFMFTVTDRVTNKSAAAVTLYPFGLLSRQGDPVLKSSRISYEGPLGVLDGTLVEQDYKSLIKDKRKTADSVGGWLGMTDKYWLIAIAPPQDEKLQATFTYRAVDDTNPNLGHFQSDFRGDAMAVAPGATIQHETHMFAGAKRVKLLDGYSDKLGIPHLDRAIDFGWFYFLTKPFLYMLNYLAQTLGSFGVAILVFTVMLKLVTLPLSLKSNHSMAKMKKLQPQINKLKETYADDKLRQNQEMMELFKREKVNPMSGCVPQLIQIPIFFALYKVLYVGIELRHAPFFGWIRDMSSPDPTSVFTFFGAAPWTVPTAMHIGVWPILMGLSMFAQQRMSPQPTEQAQARMFMVMPILFTYMLAQMPAGLVIYWTWSNLLSMGQQWFIMRRDNGK